MGRDAVLGAVRDALGRTAGDPVGSLAPFVFPQQGLDDLVSAFRVALDEVNGEFVDARGDDLDDVLAPFAAAGAGVVRVAHGVAESGSVVVERDGDHQPSLLPETTVFVLPVDGLVAGLQDLPAPSEDVRARVVVTGPSRTADIEKRLVLGAHGPKRVVVVLVDAS